MTLPERQFPECIRLPVRAGYRASAKPPVRIFLGTEASQFRPERVLVWSIERVRDPGRVYEIFLMKELAGFDRTRWTTGFTNYRFAIPAFAGGGRAIYNDEDQIYCTDPAELFDLEMGEKGFLAISETESSVMLIDCDRMSSIWTLQAARHGRKKQLLSQAVDAGWFGELDPHWNARDGEFVVGRSHLLHYTTLHTQPWRPFPERFVYRDSPLGHLWHDLEHSADAAMFSLFDRDRPSSRFGSAVEGVCAAAGKDCPELEEAIRNASVESLQQWDPLQRPAVRGADALVCTGGLDAVPEDDLPWILDEIFAGAQRFVFAAVETRTDRVPSPTETETRTAPDRWKDHFRAAGRRHPEIRWELLVRSVDPASEQRRDRYRDRYYAGGPRFDPQPPRVWLAADSRPESLEAADSLCEELGWPTERVGPDLAGLAPPWPDLLIASGPGTTAVVDAVRSRSLGRTWVVTIGANEGDADVDLAVTSASVGGFAHPRRFEIAAPLVRRPEASDRAAEKWRNRFENTTRPRVVVLASAEGRSRLAPDATRRLEDALRTCARSGGTVFVLADAPHADAIRHACASALGRECPGSAGPSRMSDAYLAHLAWADEFIVTANSERVLADVCKTGKPVRILLAEPCGLAERLRGAVAGLADAEPRNNRGTTRPQQGIERLCSRLIARGIVRPPRNFRAVHDQLIQRGAAIAIDSERAPVRSIDESKRLADRVRTLLGAR